jgi:hypothetical protein
MASDPVVFISSTADDLKEHREQAAKAALACGFSPRMVEYPGQTQIPFLWERGSEHRRRFSRRQGPKNTEPAASWKPRPLASLST